jgi:hypothetical protein
LPGEVEKLGGDWSVGAWDRLGSLTPNPSPGGRGEIHLGADGVEVHEPRLEERPRHRFQRLVHPPVQLDLVVQRAKDVGDGALFRERRYIYRYGMNEVAVQRWLCASGIVALKVELLEEVVGKPLVIPMEIDDV